MKSYLEHIENPPVCLAQRISFFLFHPDRRSGQRKVIRTDARRVPPGQARGDALADLEGLQRRSPGAGRDQQHHRCLPHQCGQRRLHSGCTPGHRSAPGETPCRDPACGREAAGKTGDGKGGTGGGTGRTRSGRRRRRSCVCRGEKQGERGEHYGPGAGRKAGKKPGVGKTPGEDRRPGLSRRPRKRIPERPR